MPLSKTAPRSGRRILPPYGTLEVFGSSSVTNGQNLTVNGIVRESYMSPFALANQMLGSRYDVTMYGYSGTNAAYILDRLTERLALGAADITVWWGGANDQGTMAYSMAALETMKIAVQRILNAGSFPIVVFPHLQSDNMNKWAYTAAYDQLGQEWCIANRVAFVSGTYAICAHTDKIGTPKSGVMSDALHFNATGAQLYAREIVRMFQCGANWRILGIANGTVEPEWSGQLCENPKITGSGAASGAGMSGTRCANISPTRYSGSTILCACSVGVDPYDGSYMDMDISITAGQAGASQAIQCFEQVPAANMLAGKTYAHMVDYELVSNPDGLIQNVQPSTRFSPVAQNIDHFHGSAPALPQAIGRVQSRSHRWTTEQAAATNPAATGLLIWTVPNLAGTAKVRLWANSVRETLAIS